MKLPAPILLLTAMASLISAAPSPESPPPAPGYTYHTVGDAAGWHFNSTTDTPSANYTAWALTQTFYLGDYLIFLNVDGNQTVVQTYNETTYKSCSVDDTAENDTLYWADPTYSSTLAIPLTVQGKTYYYSGDGIACRKGMAFEIQVSHGLGLPPSLNQPPPPPFTESPASAPPPPPAAMVKVPSGAAGNNCGCLLFILYVVPLVGVWLFI